MPKQTDRNWYSVKCQKGDDEAEVMIYDEIGGWGATAASFVKELKAIKAPQINLHLNTPGGSVFDGLAIYNAIKSHKSNVTTYVDGIAASIGSVVAIAGDQVRIAENAMMMVHNPSALVMGESGDMKKMADTLDKMKGQLVNTYAEKTGKSAEDVTKWMDAETWFTSQEAVDAGLADVIDSPAQITATFDIDKIKNAPESVRALFNTPGRQKAEQQKESIMDLSSFKAFAAEHPDAVKEFIEQGYSKAKNELAPKPATATALREAFPADADKGFCMDMLTENATLEQARTKYIAKQGEDIKALHGANEDLTKKLATANAGQPAIGTQPAGSADADPQNVGDPDAFAADEWEKKPEVRKGFSNKDNYVAWRSADIQGLNKVFTREPAKN